MRHITISWSKLLRYSLLFLGLSTLVTIGFLTWFSGNLAQALDWNLLVKGVELPVILIIYVSFPLLMIRFFIVCIEC